LKLTDKAVRAAPHGAKLTDDGEYGGGRLVLIVSTTGTRSWHIRSRVNGSDRSRKLGEYPTMGLAAARTAARAMGGKELVRTGTLLDLLTAYRESLGERPTARDAKIVFNLAFPEGDPLLKREAASITTADVAAVLRRRAATGITTSVNRLRSLLHAAFAHAAKYDYDPRKPAGTATFKISHNPVTGTPRIAEWERANDRVMTDDEIQLFWAKASAAGPVGAFWKLILLTGARMEQLRTADFSSEELITITDTKGRGSRAKVCLLPVVDADLTAAAKIATETASVDSLRGAGPRLLPKGVKPSDIRRTVETRMQELGISRDLRGALLSHGQTGVQAKHYERAELLPEKTAALLLWKAKIEELVA
jgi:hypothetical protein